MTTEQVFTWPNVRGQDKRLPVPSFDDLAAQARKDGFGKGHAEGLARGLEEGRLQAAAEAAEQRTALQAALAALASQAALLDERGTEQVARFVLDAFAALVGASARLTPDVFAGLMGDVLRARKPGDTLRIEAHPELVPAIRAALGDDPEQPVEANPALGAGEVVARSAAGGWHAALADEFRVLLEQALASAS